MSLTQRLILSAPLNLIPQLTRSLINCQDQPLPDYQRSCTAPVLQRVPNTVPADMLYIYNVDSIHIFFHNFVHFFEKV